MKLKGDNSIFWILGGGGVGIVAYFLLDLSRVSSDFLGPAFSFAAIALLLASIESKWCIDPERRVVWVHCGVRLLTRGRTIPFDEVRAIRLAMVVEARRNAGPTIYMSWVVRSYTATLHFTGDNSFRAISLGSEGAYSDLVEDAKKLAFIIGCQIEEDASIAGLRDDLTQDLAVPSKSEIERPEP